MIPGIKYQTLSQHDCVIAIPVKRIFLALQIKYEKNEYKEQSQFIYITLNWQQVALPPEMEFRVRVFGLLVPAASSDASYIII